MAFTLISFMLIAKIQFAPWDKVYNFSVGDLTVSVGDHVIVETELGTELGKIVTLVKDDKDDKKSVKNDKKDGQKNDQAGDKEDENEGNKENEREIKPILRKANYDDLANLPSAEKKSETLEFCRQMIAKHNLPMKLVDVHFSLLGDRLNFAFIADGRVDFGNWSRI